MFTRAAKYMSKALSYPSSLLSAAAMVAMAFVVLLVVADILIRRLSGSPIMGSYDLVTVAFSVIVWGPMAMAAFKGSHVAMTTLVDKLPRSPRLGLDLIIALVTSGMMGMFTWQLVMHGVRLGENLDRTGILKIPYEPFAYFAAFACAMLTLAFLVRVPETVGKIRKEPEALGEIQKETQATEKIEKMKGSSI